MTGLIKIHHLDDLIRKEVCARIGEEFAKYLKNKTTLCLMDEELRESFYLGNEPKDNTYLVIDFYKKGICVEKLGEVDREVPILEFLRYYGYDDFKLIIEGVLFEFT